MEYELTRLVDALPGLVWTTLPDGRCDFINQRWSEYTGLSVAQAMDLGWHIAIHPEDGPRILPEWEAILAAGKPAEVEARLRRHDGEFRLFNFRIAPVHDGEGRLVRWCGINTDIEDRRRAEEAVRAREGHFRSIFDGLPALVTLMTPDGHLDLANGHVLEFFGATLEELRSWPKDASFHPDDYANVKAAWTAAMAAGEPYDVEARQRRADGVYRWIRIQGYPLSDAGGRIVNWYSLRTDIDDSKRAQALLAGEKRVLEMVASGVPLQDILDTLCNVAEDIDGDCRCGILFFGPGSQTWGQAAGPNLPSGYNEVMHGRPAHRGSGPCGLAAAQKSPVIVTDVAADAYWASSEWAALALSHGLQACWSAPIMSQEQTALGALAIYRDRPGSPTSFQQDLIRQLTHIASIAVERARAEGALRRSEAFLLEAQRLSSTGSFLWHVESDEITGSDEAHRIYQFDGTETVTLSRLVARVHPDDTSMAAEAVAQVRADAPDFRADHRLLMPDGSIKHVRIVAHAVRGQDGQREYIGAIQDVTERQRSEEVIEKVRSELAHVARVSSLGALTASIAHEVNQPLSGIITNANTCLRMLAASPPNVEGALETARRTIRDGNRAADVITRLRTLFSKKDGVIEPVDINDAASEVVALSWNQLQRSRVLLQTELMPNLPSVSGDRVQLQQVILNLLLNAADAMSQIEERPRQVTLRTWSDALGQVCLSVQDAGIGFGPDGAERVFDAFYTTKSGGMGIGLSVSRSIIERHQGQLSAMPNEGPGVTFLFSIPYVPQAFNGTRVDR